MCEILVKAVDARMPTASEWRVQLTARLPQYEAYLAQYADVPAVEADHKRLVDYEQAVSALASGLAKEAKTGQASLTPEQKLSLAAKINDYQAAPLTEAAIAKARLYCAMPWEQSDPKAPTISQLWHYYDHQVRVEAKRADDDKAAELAKKDRAGCYKAFDPVVVMPDGHEWGREEGLPKFWIVKIPGMAVETARRWIASWMDTTNPEKPTALQRRLYRLDRTKIPQNILTTLNSTGVISVPLRTAEKFIVNQQTGVAG